MKRNYRRIEVKLLLIFVVIFYSCSEKAEFSFSWNNISEQRWIGSFFWANRLQDWKVKDGRLESAATDKNLPFRTVHVLPARISEITGSLHIEIECGIVNSEKNLPGNAFAGILVGAGGINLDYRAAALIHHTSAPNAGIIAGIDGNGNACIGKDADLTQLTYTESDNFPEKCLISIDIKPENDALYNLQITLTNQLTKETIGEANLKKIDEKLIRGNIAIVSHGGTGDQVANFWFNNLKIQGKKLDLNENRNFGPIAFSMHTLHQKTLKLNAQMMPVEKKMNNTVELQLKESGSWKTISSETFTFPSYNAIFRIENWDIQKDQAYRLKYKFYENGREKNAFQEGIIPREPLNRDTLKTVSVACVGHCMSSITSGGSLPGWTNWDYEVFDNLRRVWNSDSLYTNENIWFPHAKFQKNLFVLNPDLIFFLGDQVYEFMPTMAEYQNGDITILDYLYKWYLFGWSFRDILSRVPSITIPDDHDVYQGNIWGDSGNEPPPGADRWRQGGYTESPEFVNMVQRTMTGHLPDPYDPTPIARGIGVYYTELDYGGVSFSILEDRKFKSIPGTSEQEAKLLGERQLKFLRDWASDWKDHTEFKVSLTQTLFACVHTTNGIIAKDDDSNGWPPNGRNNALKELRKTYSFMIGGDQHLGTIVHHGVDEWDDAGYSVIAPAIGCVYPRFWQPEINPVEPDPSGEKYLGKYFDAFGNRVNVKAVANPEITNVAPAAQNDLGTGYIVVDFIKSDQSIDIHHWPVYEDLSGGNPKEHEGWPIKIYLQDNYKRTAIGYLPLLKFESIESPFIQVIDETNNELVYNLRVKTKTFRPAIFKPGKYTVRVGTSTNKIMKELKGLSMSEENSLIEIVI